MGVNDISRPYVLEREISNRTRTILTNVTKTLDRMLGYKYVFEEKDATEKRRIMSPP